MSTPMIQALLSPECYPHPCDNIQLIETHISWVILTGEFAYKIKKTLDLGFLDFSTLEKRYYFYQEELRLNQRLAPSLYLDVVAIVKHRNDWVISNTLGNAQEYALRMKQFPQQSMLEACLGQGKIVSQHILQLAESIAVFHQQIDRSSPSGTHGRVEATRNAIEENFQQLHQLQHKLSLTQLHKAVREQLEQLRPLMAQRFNQGYVRECHGDMHLGNMVLLEDKITLFDCIEFNPELYWIDVISDIAFLIMDLQHRGYCEWANAFLNHYLAQTGDYEGIPLLPLYLGYRAMVRAKVSAIQLQQTNPEKKSQELQSDLQDYLQLSQKYTQVRRGVLIITHGLSGSGKSWLCQKLAAKLDAIHLRSDVERKRLFQLPGLSNNHSLRDRDIYTPQATQATYQRLLDISQPLITNGFVVLVDATFLSPEQRQQFKQLALQQSCPFLILQLDTPIPQLQENILKRQQANKDPSEADLKVLQQQLQQFQPEHGKNIITHHWQDDIDITYQKVLQKLANSTKPSYTSGR